MNILVTLIFAYFTGFKYLQSIIILNFFVLFVYIAITDIILPIVKEMEKSENDIVENRFLLMQTSRS